MSADDIDVEAAVTYNKGRWHTSHHWAGIQREVGTVPDGIPGPQTALAVADWQEPRGLAVDGKVGPATLSAMGLDYVPGIDVSHHEGAIDWQAVAGAGYRYAWIKATQGTTFIDPRAAENAVGAAADDIDWGEQSG